MGDWQARLTNSCGGALGPGTEKVEIWGPRVKQQAPTSIQGRHVPMLRGRYATPQHEVRGVRCCSEKPSPFSGPGLQSRGPVLVSTVCIKSVWTLGLYLAFTYTFCVFVA